MSAKINLAKLGPRKIGSLKQKLKEEDKKIVKKGIRTQLWLFLP